MGSAATPQMSAQDANNAATNLILGTALDSQQPVFSQSVVPANAPVMNIVPRNVGLLQGFMVEVTATVANTDGATDATLTDFGPANMFQNISLVDFFGVTRISTSSRHLTMVNSIKNLFPYGSALVRTTGFDDPVKFGSNWSVIAAPATIAHGTSATVRFVFWIPCAYSKSDLRGAIWAGVTGATMQLNLTWNPAALAFVASGDTTNAMYTGTASMSITTANVTVTQMYWDQLIRDSRSNQPILPALSMNTVYELKETPFTGITANVENYFPYSNLRDFLSTFVIYNSTGGSGGRVTGADISYFSLQAANALNIKRWTPNLLALQTRQILSADLPPGTYYFDSRNRPLATANYGNLQIALNPITATAGAAYALVGWEDFAQLQLLGGATSLPSN